MLPYVLERQWLWPHTKSPNSRVSIIKPKSLVPSFSPIAPISRISGWRFTGELPRVPCLEAPRTPGPLERISEVSQEAGDVRAHHDLPPTSQPRAESPATFSDRPPSSRRLPWCTPGRVSPGARACTALALPQLKVRAAARERFVLASPSPEAVGVRAHHACVLSPAQHLRARGRGTARCTDGAGRGPCLWGANAVCHLLLALLRIPPGGAQNDRHGEASLCRKSSI